MKVIGGPGFRFVVWRFDVYRLSFASRGDKKGFRIRLDWWILLASTTERSRSVLRVRSYVSRHTTGT